MVLSFKIKEVKKIKSKIKKVSQIYNMNKIKKEGENSCQFKKTNNIIKFEKNKNISYKNSKYKK